MTPTPRTVLPHTARRRLIQQLGACAALGASWPGPAAWAQASAPLPPAIEQALRRAGLPNDALHLHIGDAEGSAVWAAHQADRPVNPASLNKLLVTFAALETLGPAWAWRTPVWIEGRLADGVLDGRIRIVGKGDPKWVVERLWLLVQRIRAMGVRHLRGDFVLDSSAFTPPVGQPGDFDGEAGRAYNAQPDALLLNFRSVVHRIVPDAARGVARVVGEPELASAAEVAARAPLALAEGACGDWRSRITRQVESPSGAWRFSGRFPLACGERLWTLADADPATFHDRLLRALWREAGGQFDGQVLTLRSRADDLALAPVPAGPPTFEAESPPLAEVARDINKWSNNVMAEQLFLTLALQADPARAASPAAARAWLQRWSERRVGPWLPGMTLVNGSGLSREGRTTAGWLGSLLRTAWASPVQPEFVASLPIYGADGTLRRPAGAGGVAAHLKTGSVDGISGIAGYLHPTQSRGRRASVVAILAYPNVSGARGVFDAVLRWTQEETARRGASVALRGAPEHEAGAAPGADASSTPTLAARAARTADPARGAGSGPASLDGSRPVAALGAAR